MQIKEFEAQTLKECLQQVRSALGPDAVILETRKFKKGGLFGLGARDAVAIVAAIGITVTSDLPKAYAPSRDPLSNGEEIKRPSSHREEGSIANERQVSAGSATARVAARGVYGNRVVDRSPVADAGNVMAGRTAPPDPYAGLLNSASAGREGARTAIAANGAGSAAGRREEQVVAAYPRSVSSEIAAASEPIVPPAAKPARPPVEESVRFTSLERSMGEIRESLNAMQREQRASHERTVSAVVSAVAPAVSAAGYSALADEVQPRFQALLSRMREMGVSEELTQELFDQLPNMGAWSEQAQEALAVSAMKELISRRISSRGAIELTPGRLKAVALIGPTGVGKTTTIAKLAAHFALMQGKKVALLTVDTYRIAAVEQLKTYSQIIGLPVSVAYNHAEVPPIIDQYSDYDLILIDTAGRSQKHIMQVGELKSLLDAVNCETHLVLSAPIKEQDMLEAAKRFSAARVDRIIFSKLDETSSYGTLLNVADRTGIPLSYLTTGQKVPEDIEVAEGSKLAGLIVG